MLQRSWSKFFAGLALGGCALLASTPAQAFTLADGTFESPASLNGKPWSSEGNDHVAISSKGTAHEHFVLVSKGIEVAVVRPLDVGFTLGGVYQTVKGLSAANYRISFSADNTGSNPVKVLGGFTQTLASANAQSVAPGGGWQRFGFAAHAQIPSNTYLTIEAFGSGNPFDVRLDNVSLSVDTPEIDPRYGLLPAAMAAAAVMLLNDRRRKA